MVNNIVTTLISPFNLAPSNQHPCGVTAAYTKKWVEAYKAKRAGDRVRTCKLLSELMAGFVACTDMPPIDFIPELMDIYPDAKVVLVTRDPERWLESIKPVA